MNQNTKIGLIIVSVIIVAGVVWWSINAGADDTAPQTVATTNTTNTAAAANTEATTNSTEVTADEESSVPSGARVVISSVGFSPDSVTIEAGGTVTWGNIGTDAHYVAPDDHPDHQKYVGLWNDDGLGNIEPGETYAYTFLQSGTYTYHDHLNPELTGTIIVE